MHYEIVIGSLSEGEMIPEGNSDLKEGMKSATNYNYVGKRKDYFFSFLDLLKEIGKAKKY